MTLASLDQTQSGQALAGDQRLPRSAYLPVAGHVLGTRGMLRAEFGACDDRVVGDTPRWDKTHEYYITILIYEMGMPEVV